MLNAFCNLLIPGKNEFITSRRVLGGGGGGGGWGIGRTNDQLLDFRHLQHGQVSIYTRRILTETAMATNLLD